MASHLVVVDFDGTAAVGDGPVEAYLDEVLRTVPDDGSARRALAAHLRGEDEHIDGYALVASLADGLGLTAAQRQSAYSTAREALHDGRVAVTAPPGLRETLARRPDGVRVALVTNAPATGIDRVLERVGLSFDAVVGDAGKPAGLPAILDRLLAADGLPPERLLAVGDIWVNDLEPAARVGAATAYVDRHGRGDGAPTLRARTLTELLPAIEAWWSA